jgi:hypothetical protein
MEEVRDKPQGFTKVGWDAGGRRRFQIELTVLAAIDLQTISPPKRLAATFRGTGVEQIFPTLWTEPEELDLPPRSMMRRLPQRRWRDPAVFELEPTPRKRQAEIV